MHLTSTLLLTFLSTLTLAIPIHPSFSTHDYDIDAIISEKHASILPSANLLNSYLTPSHYARSLSEDDLLLDLLSEDDDDKTAVKLRSSKSLSNLGASLRKAISLPALRAPSRPPSPAPPVPPKNPPPVPPVSTKPTNLKDPKPDPVQPASGNSLLGLRPSSPVGETWSTVLKPRPLSHQLGWIKRRDVVDYDDDDDDEEEEGKKAMEGLVRFLVDEEEKRARAEWWR